MTDAVEKDAVTADTIARLTRERDAMREALEPFAEVGRALIEVGKDSWPDDVSARFLRLDNIKVRHFREIAAALSSAGEGAGPSTPAVKVAATPSVSGRGQPAPDTPAGGPNVRPEFKPCIIVNEEAFVTEFLLEDVATVSRIAFQGFPHTVDWLVSFDNRLVGVQVWRMPPKGLSIATPKPDASGGGDAKLTAAKEPGDENRHEEIAATPLPPAPVAGWIYRAAEAFFNCSFRDMQFKDLHERFILAVQRDTPTPEGEKSGDGWLDIETAPKDDTRVDLWVRSKHQSDDEPSERRVPNARRCYNGGKWPDVWIDEDGKYVNGYRHHEDGDEHFTLSNEVPTIQTYAWTVVTHWRPPPAPPVSATAHPHKSSFRSNKRTLKSFKTGWPATPAPVT